MTKLLTCLNSDFFHSSCILKIDDQEESASQTELIDVREDKLNLLIDNILGRIYELVKVRVLTQRSSEDINLI